VQIGLESANAGNLIPSAEVEAKFAAKRTATRRRLKAAAELESCSGRLRQYETATKFKTTSRPTTLLPRWHSMSYSKRRLRGWLTTPGWGEQDAKRARASSWPIKITLWFMT
jgi:hypothetical protein